MIAISDDFKNAMKSPTKEIDAYVNGDIAIRSSDDLISFKISCDTGLCKTAMRKIEAKYIGEHNLLGQWVNAGFGVKLPSGSFDYLDYGSFLITEITTVKDSGITTVVGYDKMINAMVPYHKLNIEYPINLYDYTKRICDEISLELGNTSFGANNNWEIDRELWENIDGITYRDILVQIAQATGTTCIINNENKIYFKSINNTGEQLTYDNMKKLKLEPLYGEINSVILGRDPIVGEDVYLKDNDSIATNGLTEFRIDNNEIVDKDRENAITPIYNALHGISYYPFETTTEGLGWYEIGDSFDIINDTNDVFNTVLFNFNITVDGAIKEILKAVAETKTQSQYQYATTISKRLKNTEIIVNKQEGYIEQLVTDMYEEDGVVSEKFTKVYLDLENIINSVQNSGGANLIKNSVMFAYDDKNVPSSWDISEEGTLVIGASAESLANGGLSAHAFQLIGKTVSQKIYVKADDDSSTNKTYYTFSTKIKKGATGSCYVKIYNSNEEYIIELKSGESSYWKEYTLQALLPKDNYYIIEFYGSEDSETLFTDNMFSIGEYKTQWEQASGEIMNTQVNINLDGVLVKSSVYLGDYTVMSPLEFAGYSNINGTVTKIFSLNKDVTLVKKLEAEDEIKMIPIKIVPITSGDLQGWGFVPSTEDN